MGPKRIRSAIIFAIVFLVTFLVVGRVFQDVLDVSKTLGKLPILYSAGDLDNELASLRKETTASNYRTSRTFPPAEAVLAPSRYNYSITVVTGKKSGEDTAWLDEELPHLQHKVYVVDDTFAALHTPKNKGNEAMVYLSYIIDNYESLPDVSVFVHSSRWAWHNNDVFGSDVAEAIRHLLPQAVIRAGYVNLRCQWHPGCPAWIHPSSEEKNILKGEESSVKEAWPHLFPGEPLPDVLAQPCCSQFALSKSRIAAVEKEEYVRLRDWLLGTTMTDHLVGRVFEYAWHVLWTGKAVHCPSQHACHCDVFGVCFDDEDDFQSWFEMRYYLKRDQKEWESWHGQMVKVENLAKEGDIKSAKELEMPPVGRMEELKVAINARWIELLEKKWVALEKGRSGKVRAGVAGREADDGDLG